MKPSPASPPPPWLADIFPCLSDHTDTTDYNYEEQVARMIGGGLPETWVRGGLARLAGGPWQDRVLRFADTNAPALAALGWQLSDLFPPGETERPHDHMHGYGWALLDALNCGGVIVSICAARIAYADSEGMRRVIEKRVGDRQAQRL